NPLLGPTKVDYEFDPGTQLLLGQRYALVRPEIRRLRPVRAQEPPPVTQANGKPTNTEKYRVLVSLGDDDPNRQTVELARYLLNVPRIARVDVLVRAEHPDQEALTGLAAANPERLEVATFTTPMPQDVTGRIARAHFAVTSGSGWSLE